MTIVRYSIIGLLFSVFIIVLNFYLIKKRKITSLTFTIWIIIGFLISIISIIPSVYSLIFVIFGTQFLLSSITAAGFLFLMAFIFYLNVAIDGLKDKLMKLTVIVTATNFNLRKKREK